MNFGRIGRQELLDLVSGLLEATLETEWVSHEVTQEAQCAVCGKTVGLTHHAECSIDAILVRCGLPDQAARDDVRKKIRDRRTAR